MYCLPKYEIYQTYEWKHNRTRLLNSRVLHISDVLIQVTATQSAPSPRHARPDYVDAKHGCDETDDTRCVLSAISACENMAEEKRVQEVESSRSKAVEFLVGDANSSEDLPITSNGTLGEGLKPYERRRPCLIGVAGGTASGKVCRRLIVVRDLSTQSACG